MKKQLGRLFAACLLAGLIGSEAQASPPQTTTPPPTTAGADSLMADAATVVDAIAGYFGFSLTDEEKEVAVGLACKLLQFLEQYQQAGPPATP